MKEINARLSYPRHSVNFTKNLAEKTKAIFYRLIPHSEIASLKVEKNDAITIRDVES